MTNSGLVRSAEEILKGKLNFFVQWVQMKWLLIDVLLKVFEYILIKLLPKACSLLAWQEMNLKENTLFQFSCINLQLL